MKKILIALLLIIAALLVGITVRITLEKRETAHKEMVQELISEYVGIYSGFVQGTGMMAEMVIGKTGEVYIRYARGMSMHSMAGLLKYESGRVLFQDIHGETYPLYRLMKAHSGKGYHLKLRAQGIGFTLNYMNPLPEQKPKPVREPVKPREPLSQKKRELTGPPMRLLVVKGSENPEHYPTLAEAVNSSRAGDTIALTAGVYRGPVRLKANQVLLGDSTFPTIDGEEYGWVVAAAESSEIKNLTIINSGSAAGISDCGVLIRSVNKVHVTDCNIVNNGHYGVVLNTTQGTVVENCLISKNKILGIYVSRDVEAKVLNNEITHHPVYGIDFNKRTVVMELRGNRFISNKRGISNVMGRGETFKVSVIDNSFEKHELAIYSDYEELKMKGNTFLSNEENLSDLPEEFEEQFGENNTLL